MRELGLDGDGDCGSVYTCTLLLCEVGLGVGLEFHCRRNVRGL